MSDEVYWYKLLFSAERKAVADEVVGGLGGIGVAGVSRGTGGVFVVEM